MNSMLDYIGSFMIAGMLLLGFAHFSGERQVALLEASSNASNQTLMSSFAELMMSDLRKCGYGCTGEAFVTIEPRRIVFLADIDANSTVDTVKYWFAGAVTSSPNPSDTLLYRQINSAPAKGSSLGLVRFRLRYYNASGNETSDPVAVRTVSVETRIQSLVQVNGRYAETRTTFRITPKNNR